MTLEEQTTDPTRYRFPSLWSASHTDHISNLEKALAAVQAVAQSRADHVIRLEQEIQRLEKELNLRNQWLEMMGEK